jgi:hypothetical protein
MRKQQRYKYMKKGLMAQGLKDKKGNIYLMAVSQTFPGLEQE